MMKKAIVAVRNEEMGTLFASKTFDVPRFTLQRMARSNASPSLLLKTPLGRKPILDEATEKYLVKYTLEMESRLCGLTRHDIRSLAFQLTELPKCQTNFRSLSNLQGKVGCMDSCAGTKNELSFRSPTGTSFNRAMGSQKKM